MGKTDRIEIVPYRDEWPSQFQQAKQLLAKFLQDLSVSIDHIGSTSVPGLRAKDRIDIQITVSDLSGDFKNAFDLRLRTGGFPESRSNQDHRPPGDKSGGKMGGARSLGARTRGQGIVGFAAVQSNYTLIWW